MIAHGDEIARTQRGNNNVYCQDNETSWVSWQMDPEKTALLAFTRRLTKLRARHPAFRRRRFFAGDAKHGGESSLGDIAWFQPDGSHMDEKSWQDGRAQELMVFLNGGAIPESDTRGRARRRRLVPVAAQRAARTTWSSSCRARPTASTG